MDMNANPSTAIAFMPNTSLLRLTSPSFTLPENNREINMGYLKEINKYYIHLLVYILSQANVSNASSFIAHNVDIGIKKSGMDL
jgi:hypothetical protein